MAWVHIEDNAKAWELYQAELLWHGDPEGGMIQYPKDAGQWSRADWMRTRFIGGRDRRRNYILVEY